MPKLNTLATGTNIVFAGRDWILLDPASGYVVMKHPLTRRGFDPDATDVFDVHDSNNIGYYLNTTYYNTLTPEYKAMIQQKTWGIGRENNEASKTVTANVCLLSHGDWRTYSKQYNTNSGVLDNPSYDRLLRTPGGPYDATKYTVWSVSTTGYMRTIISGTADDIYAAVYLKPTLNVINGIVVDNSAPSSSQIPAQSVKKNATVTLNLANYFKDDDGDVLSYSAASSNSNIATAVVSGNNLILTGVAIGGVTVTVTASDGKLTATQPFTLNVTNTAPVVSVSSPSTNVTLYENDTFNLAGSATDVDTYQSVTVYAQINDEQRIVLNVGLSNAPVTFNKQLTFKAGKIYDGDTLIAGNLADGVPHKLKIWAQDGDGGKSAETERAFYVVPNRPPTLTVDAVQPSGIINTDKFAISGTAGDPDGNSVSATYRINSGNNVPLQITSGKWAFDIALAQLQVGQNSIVIELTDSYDFKVSKTIKLNKDEVKTPILQSIARYKIEPPKGSAKGVLLWIQRDGNLDLKAELSMTLRGEQEQYVTLTSTNTAPVSEGVVEDEFYHEATEAKDNIILKLSAVRNGVNIDHRIHLISGVLE